MAWSPREVLSGKYPLPYDGHWLHGHYSLLSMALSTEILEIRASHWKQESTSPNSLEIGKVSLFHTSNLAL